MSPINEEFLGAAFASSCNAVRKHLDGLNEGNDEFRLQHGLYNMLELAAYFLGAPFDALEGMRDNESGPADHWIMVGPDPRIATVRLSSAHALEELDARQETNADACVFCLPAEGNPWWRKYRNSKSEDLRENTAKLLAFILRKPSTLPAEICRLALGEETLTATARQARVRFKEDLARLTGLSEENFQSPGSICLPADFLVFGAIAERRLPREV
jgi:hypothetical protein